MLLPQTVGYDPLVPAAEAGKFGVEFVGLEEMWPLVDFVTVHTPLVKATRGELSHCGWRMVPSVAGGWQWWCD